MPVLWRYPLRKSPLQSPTQSFFQHVVTQRYASQKGDATRGKLNNGDALKSRNVETSASVHGFVRDRLKTSFTMTDKEE